MVAVGLVPARLPPVSRRLGPPPLLLTIVTLARIFFSVSRSNIHLARHPGEARSCKRYRPVATSLAGRSSLDCWIETNSGQEILAVTSPKRRVISGRIVDVNFEVKWLTVQLRDQSQGFWRAAMSSRYSFVSARRVHDNRGVGSPSSKRDPQVCGRQPRNAVVDTKKPTRLL